MIDKNILKKHNPENLLEAQLFELYYSLGSARTRTKLLPLAKKLEKKISFDRITRMSIRLFWYDRVKSRDYNQIVTMKESTARNIDELKLKLHEAIKNTILREFETVSNERTGQMETRFKIKIRNINELDQAIKSMLLLAGEATDIYSVKITVVETIIQKIIQIISFYVKDPKVLADIAIDLKGIERS